MLKVQAEKILQQEMDRKAFLRNTGIAFGVLTGVTAIISKLNIIGADTKQQSVGYGASTYGGSPAAKKIS